MASDRRMGARLRLLGARLEGGPAATLSLVRGVVVADAPDAPAVDVSDLVLLPGLVNADDHLELATLPPLGRPPYGNVYEWTADLAGGPALADAFRIPEIDRLWLGGLRNLLAGVTSVLHHGPYHRSMARDDFPVRVQHRYAYAVSPEATPALRRSYRTTDRRVPWTIHCAEGTDARVGGEVATLAAANVLRQNSVLVHGIALGPGDAERIAAASACVVWCPEVDRRLYGATADVRVLRAAGVRVGLGTDSAAAGGRDALSNLAAARAEQVVTDAELLEMATHGSGVVARMPAGGAALGAPADYVAVSSTEALLAGDRRAVLLVVSGGRALYGLPDLLDAAGGPWAPMVVDGERRALAADAARRLRTLLKGGAARAGAAWLAGVGVPDGA